jgi:prophage maintenance system killer protein
VILLAAADVLAVAVGLHGGRVEELAEVDLAGLEAAVGRANDPVPSTAAEAAARLFAEVARAAPFAASSKPVGWLAACQLLSLNDLAIPADDDPELKVVLVRVAGGEPVSLLSELIGSRCAQSGRAYRKEEAMFERFSDSARLVLALAADEARRLHHNFIGTEHVLLGMLAERHGTAAQSLDRAGITLDAARESVAATIGPISGDLLGSPPFTPRAKRILELSLQEAMALRSKHIGTEHLLLGLIQEGEGVGAQTIRKLGVDPLRLRQATIDLARGLIVQGPALEPIDLGSVRLRIVGEIDALASRIRDLEAECQRLKELLQTHGIDPDGGEQSA